jgi:hypothetical protein
LAGFGIAGGGEGKVKLSAFSGQLSALKKNDKNVFQRNLLALKIRKSEGLSLV